MTIFAFETNGLPDDIVRRELLVLLSAYTRRPPAYGLIIFNTEGASQMGEITVKDDETTLRYSVTLLDSEGQPTTADSPPTVTSSDESVVVPHPAEDGLSGTIDVGSPGSAIVTVTATETHDGVGDPTEIVFTGLVNVVAGDAVTGSVDFATG